MDVIAEVGWENSIILLGYDLPQQRLRPGDGLSLTLYWQALRPIDADYTVFVHVLGRQHNPRTGNPLWGQVDMEPVAGTYPTSAWSPGEQIIDRYVVTVDPEAPPGDYGLEIGLYDAINGQRLAVYDPGGDLWGDYLIVARVQVQPKRDLGALLKGN